MSRNIRVEDVRVKNFLVYYNLTHVQLRTLLHIDLRVLKIFRVCFAQSVDLREVWVAPAIGRSWQC